MDLLSLYEGLLAAFSALIYVSYLGKILKLSLTKQAAIIFIKFIVNIAVVVSVVSLFRGVDAIHWKRILYMALFMQIILPSVLILRNYFKFR